MTEKIKEEELETKTTHEIWRGHYHNDAEPEGEIPCEKLWISKEVVDEKLCRLKKEIEEMKKKAKSCKNYTNQIQIFTLNDVIKIIDSVFGKDGEKKVGGRGGGVRAFDAETDNSVIVDGGKGG